MRWGVTDEEVVRYREDGFLVVDDFLTEAELAEWRAALDEALAERDERAPGVSEAALSARWGDTTHFRFYQRVFTQRLLLFRTSARMRALVLDERLGELAATLEGVDAVRVWQDQALVKEPWANPTAFHLDGPIFPMDTPHVISLWVALDDATLINGCLGYVPGSHRYRGSRNATIAEDLGALFGQNPELRAIDPVYCPIPAGGALLHNGYMAHGAGANMTHGRRRAMTVVYMEDGATYDRPGSGTWTWTDEEQARYAPGDRLEHPEQFPLVYSRA
jgi:phytanoyl-CoA hydroxylase